MGYGHTRNVKVGQTVTKEKAEKLLLADLVEFEREVNSYVKQSITQSMYEALVSFTFNVGADNFSKSALLKYLNKGDYEKAYQELPLWNKSKGIVLRGLINRRLKEANLFKMDGLNVSANKGQSETGKTTSKIKSVGQIIVDGVKNYTYIYEKTSDTSKQLGKANKGDQFDIAGSVTGWYEIIYEGERAYIKSKYCSKV
ncbi:lysozyme [Paenibacillus sp. F6_3S_P_1C]|uniref:Lysozyme n=1 Tax=Paenibacillus vandeheii TaxID=3035917 RepID=A0ABT8JFQ3_9BACL|nr:MULTISPECIES: lysozyme [Paenibacillus]MDN4603936.1 lysozyme [Paenibacillus vandeheii]